jgi:hypothetical protein
MRKARQNTEERNERGILFDNKTDFVRQICFEIQITLSQSQIVQEFFHKRFDVTFGNESINEIQSTSSNGNISVLKMGTTRTRRGEKRKWRRRCQKERP